MKNSLNFVERRTQNEITNVDEPRSCATVDDRDLKSKMMACVVRCMAICDCGFIYNLRNISRVQYLSVSGRSNRHLMHSVGSNLKSARYN